jgi:rod shape-determining protein MreC
VPDEKTIRRRRAGFLLLLLATFILLTGSFVGAFGGAERGVNGIVSPIQEAASRVAKPVRDLVNWVGDTFRAKGELEKVTADRDRYQLANARLIAGWQTKTSQDAVDKIVDGIGLAKYAPVSVSLVFQSTSAWYRSIGISKGTSDGVTEGDPVIGPNGLVGKVISSTGGSAIVRLVTDPDSGVNSQVEPSGLKGPLSPAKVGSVGDLVLDVRKSADIKPGNLVMTAGSMSSRLQSPFPKGIPVGRVTRVEDPGEDSQVVHVRASADLERLDTLTVLTDVQAGDQ